MLDYLIVGLGLSGLSFAEELEANGKSYKVFENASQKSSRVAGGLYNPVILKRFTMAWQASEQLVTALDLYRRIEEKLGYKVIQELRVLRRFNSVEEQNNWFQACDKPVLTKFLSPDLSKNTNPALDVPYHYGEVKYTGKIDIKDLLGLYEDYLKKKNIIEFESFDYSLVEIDENYIKYKGEKYRQIVFAEGFGVKSNPFFKDLPLYGNKGEYIIIKSEGLKLYDAVKSSIFIIPLGKDLYKVGATYNNEDKSLETTIKAREELKMKLSKFIKTTYQIVDQVAGIRPTVRDRRPIVGAHPSYANLHILNGMGSRGILIAPTMAKKLYDYIENGVPLEKEIDISRFNTL